MDSFSFTIPQNIKFGAGTLDPVSYTHLDVYKRQLIMWAYNETFYQIYPIGFCGAPTHNDGICVPRILKLKDWSSYLENLQIGSVLLNPIFESDNHGYDTRDFKKVDCRLGTNEDFQDVCDDLHKHHIKIVLDGVFNHVGRGFWAFQDVQEKKWDSPYKDWFYINFDGDSCYQDGFWYEGWEGHFELVKLNLQNPAVTDYLLDCVRFWIETFDIDGLRLDVAYSLDHNFMRRLRSFCEEQKPGFVLIGEVLFGDYNLIVNDEMLHSLSLIHIYGTPDIQMVPASRHGYNRSLYRSTVLVLPGCNRCRFPAFLRFSEIAPDGYAQFLQSGRM